MCMLRIDNFSMPYVWQFHVSNDTFMCFLRNGNFSAQYAENCECCLCSLFSAYWELTLSRFFERAISYVNWQFRIFPEKRQFLCSVYWELWVLHLFLVLMILSREIVIFQRTIRNSPYTYETARILNREIVDSQYTQENCERCLCPYFSVYRVEKLLFLRKQYEILSMRLKLHAHMKLRNCESSVYLWELLGLSLYFLTWVQQVCVVCMHIRIC